MVTPLISTSIEPDVSETTARSTAQFQASRAKMPLCEVESRGRIPVVTSRWTVSSGPKLMDALPSTPTVESCNSRITMSSSSVTVLGK